MVSLEQPRPSRYPDQQCEWHPCTEAAVGWLEAQWTLFDFLEYRFCETHHADMREALASQTVDGEPVVTLWTHYFDD